MKLIIALILITLSANTYAFIPLIIEGAIVAARAAYMFVISGVMSLALIGFAISAILKVLGFTDSGSKKYD